MEKDNNRGMEMAKVMKSESIKSLGKEYLELGIDSVLESGALKDLPIVNSVMGVCNVVGSIKDHLLASKLLRFMDQLSKIPHEERVELVDRLNDDKAFAGRAGSAVIEILDRMESEKKPELSAIFFGCYARNQISIVELRRCLWALERIPTFDIEHLEEFSASTYQESLKMDDSLLLAYVGAGLGVNNGGWDGGAIIPTDLCKTFVECLYSPNKSVQPSADAPAN